MPKLNLVRNIMAGEELRSKIDSGVNKIFDVALASYGVNSGNVMIEHRFGEPLISHDGITNIGKLVVSDPIENSTISIVRQASEKTNRDAGDATTLTVVLSKLAYDYWKNAGAVKDQYSPRKVQKMIGKVVADVKQYIQDNKQETTPDTLKGVARISAGDQAIGDLVCDAVQTVGKDGGITVVETATPNISSEVVNGFTFKKGLKAIPLANDLQALKSRYNDPTIIVMSRLLSKNDDIVPILDKALIADRHNILLIADISGQALETIIANKLNGRLDIAVVEPPAEGRDIFLTDVAKYSSTNVFSGSPDDFDVDLHCGTAESAYITLSETTINGCKTPDDLAKFIESLDDNIRIERLTGKTVKISVGAPTQAERQELKLRIEDAVCATQTALEYGVLPGGGVFLRDMFSQLYALTNGHDFNSEHDMSYFVEPFKILTGDTQTPLAYSRGAGVDIYNDKNIENMVEAGIVDSAKAIEEAVINSHSVAAQLISVKMALPFVDDME